MMINIRNNFNRLAESLIIEGKKDSAIQVLDRCLELIPKQVVPYNYFSQQTAGNYFAAGAIEKGDTLMRDIVNDYKAEMNFYLNMDSDLQASVDSYNFV